MEIVIILRFVVRFFLLILQVQLLLQLLCNFQVVNKLWWLVQLGFLLFCDRCCEESALGFVSSNNLFCGCEGSMQLSSAVNASPV